MEAISGIMTCPGSVMEPRGVANGVISGEGTVRPGGGAYWERVVPRRMVTGAAPPVEHERGGGR